jgi:transposase
MASKVVDVADERKKASLQSYYATLSEARKAGIESVSRDMWPAYINTALENLPGGEKKITFDKFHVVKYLNEALDKVRRQEHKALMSEGWEDLKGTKYDWLSNRGNLGRKRQRSFKLLRESTLKTARACAIRDLAMHLWSYVSRTWAEKRWKQWLSWAVRSRLEPIKKVAKTIKEHLWDILNAIILKASNSASESINSRINMIKIRSHGFRNKARYRNAIYFYLGGLDLYPEGVIR